MSNYFKHKMRGKSPAAIAAMIIFGIFAIGGLAILLGFVVMWLWNWLMPMLFGLPIISYWQAVGLFILAKLLLGGCGGSGGSKKHHSHKCEDNKKKKTDFSKWEHYDKFWQEKGDKAYQDYVESLENDDAIPKPKDFSSDTNNPEVS